MDQISQGLLNLQRKFTSNKKSIRSKMSFLTAIDALTPQDFSFPVLRQIYTSGFNSLFLLPSLGLLGMVGYQIHQAYSISRQMQVGPEFHQKGVKLRAGSLILAFTYLGFSYISLLLVHGNLAKHRREKDIYQAVQQIKRETGYISFMKHCRRMGEMIKEAKIQARNSRRK